MNMISRFIAIVVAGVVLSIPALAVSDSNATPDFSEVRSVLAEHLAGTSDAELDRAAVEGLLSELKGKVTLVTNSNASATNDAVPLLVSAQRIFDKDIGYVRINNVEAGLDRALGSSVERIKSSNSLAGLVLDLRYAEGSDYSAAAAAVDLFLAKEAPLLNAGKGLISSKEKADAIRLPVVALVNYETSGAAEAVAAMLRQAGVGLLIGARTAGRAGVTTDFKLSSGHTLRVVTAPVQLGNAKPIPATGVVPDIDVEITSADEKAYFADPYGSGAATEVNGAANGGTNTMASAGSSKRIRVTEADLVREKRGDGDVEAVASARLKAQESTPRVTDPVLARAIDLLKGLAVVRQWKF